MACNGLTIAQDSAVNHIAIELARVQGSSSPVEHISRLFKRIPISEQPQKRASIIENATWFEVDWTLFKRLKRSASDLISLDIPIDSGSITLDLYKHNPLSEDFKTVTASGNVTSHHETYYRGIIRGDQQSIATISLLDGELMGVVSSSTHGNIVIGKDESHDMHVSYKDSDLKILNDFSCEVLETPGEKASRIEPNDRSARSAGSCVKVYFEVTNDLFKEMNNSVSAVISHVTGLFNVVSTIYANENLSVKISDIFVWDIIDPYTSSTAAAALQSFLDHRTSFNGNLAHLLDGGNGNGGIAYVDVLCDPSFAYGYSRIDKNYNGFPNYSWTVNVVAHELGHNFGSRHTQDCVWGNDQCMAIDGCYQSDPDVGCGTCDPGPLPSKGTIMSYCYLKSNVGVDFSLGFGPEPGALIRSRASAASCLDDCNSASACNLEITAVNVTDATCGQSNGLIEIEITGANGTILYDIGNGPQSRNVFENVPAGNYTITVNSGLTCFRTSSATVKMIGSKPQIAATVSNSACNKNTGSIEIEVTKGTAPYTYKLGNKSQSSPLFDQLAPKDYKIVVTDANGCMEDKSLTVFYDNPPSHSALLKHTSCGEENGQVLFEVEGGTAPFIYELGNLRSEVDHFLNLSPGTYEATVTDKNGCKSSSQIKIFDSEAISMNVLSESTDCGHDNGYIEIKAGGGEGKLEYSIGDQYTSKFKYSDLAPGEYVVSVRDELLCLEEQTIIIDGSIGPEISVDPTNTSCGKENGKVIVRVEGDAGPYSFESPLFEKNSDGTFLNVPSGTFRAKISDQRGCLYDVTTEIAPSSSPSPIADIDPTHCGLDNGRLDIGVTGGVGPFVYRLSEKMQSDSFFEGLAPGSYDLVVEDAVFCMDSLSITIDSSEAVLANFRTLPTSCANANGSIVVNPIMGISPFEYRIDSIAQADSVIQNLASGAHVLAVIDSDGCQNIDTIYIESSLGVELRLQTVSTTCGEENGIIDIETIRGNGPVSLFLNDEPQLDQKRFDNLNSGEYTIIGRDSLGCESSMGVTIHTSSRPILSAQKEDTQCGEENGHLEIEVSAGVGPYTISVNGYETPPLPMEKLRADDYHISVKDSLSCSDTIHVTILPSTRPILSSVVEAAYCEQSNGKVLLAADQGVAPYEFSIDASPFDDQTSYEKLDTGTHIVLLKDAAGCLDTLLAEVEYDDQFIAPALKDLTSICANDPASLKTGLNDNVAITWFKNDTLLQTDETQIEVTDPGIYIASVQYLSDCVLRDTSIVQNHPKPEVDLVEEDFICLGEAFFIKDTSPKLEYLWSNDSIGRRVYFNESGDYGVSIKNEFGCIQLGEISIDVIQPVQLKSGAADYYICPGDDIVLAVDGAMNYAWQSEDISLDMNSSMIIVSPSENMSYQVIGSNTCFSDTLMLHVEVATKMPGIPADTAVIEGSPLKLEIPGIESARWSSSYTMDCTDCLDPIIRPVIEGLVEVEYIDSNGCTWSDQINIEVIPLQTLIPTLVNFISPNSDGLNDYLMFEGLDLFDQVSLEVFDQNGIKIYQTTNYDNRWSGTANGNILPEGVYFYFLTLQLDDRIFHFDSDLTIVRD